MYSMVLCTDLIHGIGMNDGTIPFKNKGDLANFKALTLEGIVIMGRKTWQSLPIKPLRNRLNIIISTQGPSILEDPLDNVLVFTNIIDCLIELNKPVYKDKNKFVIGGATIYEYFLNNNIADTIYHTIIHHNYECDINVNLYSVFNWDWRRDMIAEKKIQDCQPLYKCEYWIYSRPNKEEERFLKIMRKILTKGTIRYDRTGTGTLAIFHNELTFDLTNNNFPLLTTRKMNLRLIFEELMFFLRGQTDNHILRDKNINIWTPNTTREFLDNRGLINYIEGDMGPTYGFLFRHQGAKYINCRTDYTGQGFDQVNNVIRLLREDPYSRRIMINLWDASKTDQMSLPPCLFNYQFYVEIDNCGKKWLSCKMTQRSSDISLAGGWNVATGSLLVYMLAYITDMYPYKLIWSTGDTHIYLNQKEAVLKQLERKPNIFPKLYIKNSCKKNINDFEFDDILLINYHPHPSIRLNMNA